MSDLAFLYKHYYKVRDRGDKKVFISRPRIIFDV